MKVHLGRFRDHNKKTGVTPERIIRVKIDKFDTWSMDHTLALIIHPMLIQLKATQHGAGWTDDEDVPEALRSTAAPAKENDYDVDDNHFKRWEWIMDEMIWAFGAHIDDDAEDQFYSGESHNLWVVCDLDGTPLGEPKEYGDRDDAPKGACYYRMVKGPNDTFVVDREGLDAFGARKKNAFRLFGKYYMNLWD